MRQEFHEGCCASEQTEYQHENRYFVIQIEILIIRAVHNFHSSMEESFLQFEI